MNRTFASSKNPCFCCDRADGREIVSVPGAMSPEFKACRTCILKHGHRELRDVADAILAAMPPNARAKLKPACLHCGAPVFLNQDGSQPMWCRDCETQRRRVAQGGDP